MQFSRGRQISDLDRLHTALSNIEQLRPGVDRTEHAASISRQLEKLDNRMDQGFARVDNGFSRIDNSLNAMSRDNRMVDDELIRLRRSLSSLEDCVKSLVDGRVSGSGSGGVMTSSSASNVRVQSLRSEYAGNTELLGRVSSPSHACGDNAGVVEVHRFGENVDP